MLPKRRIADLEVSALGLGCMSLTHAYGTPVSRVQAESLLLGRWTRVACWRKGLRPLPRDVRRVART